MVDQRQRAAFEIMAIGGRGDAGALAIGLQRESTGLGLRALGAKLLHVAIVAPERLTDIYDNMAAGWFGRPVFAPRTFRPASAVAEPPEGFWEAFWDIVERPRERRPSEAYAGFTEQLAAQLGLGLHQKVAVAAREFPGVEAAAAQGPTQGITAADLDGRPAGSLGAALRDAYAAGVGPHGLAQCHDLNHAALPAPLPYLHLESQSFHLLWRLVAGYRLGGADDLAFAAFEMGQFGCHCSALLNGLIFAIAAVHRETFAHQALDAIGTGWIHGRETPCLLGVDWRAMLDEPIGRVRARLGVTDRDTLFAAFPIGR